MRQFYFNRKQVRNVDSKNIQIFCKIIRFLTSISRNRKMKYKRLSAQKYRQIIRCFCADITATACAEIVGVNRNTVNSWYNEFRHKILLAAIAETRAEGGEFEVDESYFGARRVRGKRGARGGRKDAGVRPPQARR